MAILTVLQSIAFREAFLELAGQFHRASGHTTRAVFDGGLNVSARIAAGERVDAVVMSADAIDEMARGGHIAPGGRIDLAISPIGCAVRAGAACPMLETEADFISLLRASRSIAYSTGPSGVHLIKVLDRLGLSGELAARLRQVRGEPAGAAVARGECDLAFQQMSELLPVPGIDIAGLLPETVQKTTLFSIGLHAAAPEPDATRALMRFLASPEAAPVIRAKGMQPLAG
ncbi:MAG: substrate-binding domain-containing protein [Rhodocyclaceae bacterium]|nr:substrate-binding domain-containing protein [Rhodocyclaceae bacterium]MCA3073631.1 substrate-binding domain-containing protein [Rhodocyclaceae bacterium]MCA3089012.1 substrate-binding domain-containing protein [Rhodocyclaceae bacterium]MCA3095748.1 substrate-binding domain-containing protein [Rhodocyclaceae bacterium]MCA3097755.1 substrate-binding domain-containing protein [Rhodocyclaceae bacterium]